MSRETDDLNPCEAEEVQRLLANWNREEDRAKLDEIAAQLAEIPEEVFGKSTASITEPLSQFLTVMNRRHGRLIRLQELCAEQGGGYYQTQGGCVIAVSGTITIRSGPSENATPRYVLVGDFDLPFISLGDEVEGGTWVEVGFQKAESDGGGTDVGWILVTSLPDCASTTATTSAAQGNNQHDAIGGRILASPDDYRGLPITIWQEFGMDWFSPDLFDLYDPNRIRQIIRAGVPALASQYSAVFDFDDPYLSNPFLGHSIATNSWEATGDQWENALGATQLHANRQDVVNAWNRLSLGERRELMNQFYLGFITGDINPDIFTYAMEEAFGYNIEWENVASRDQQTQLIANLLTASLQITAHLREYSSPQNNLSPGIGLDQFRRFFATMPILSDDRSEFSEIIESPEYGASVLRTPITIRLGSESSSDRFSGLTPLPVSTSDVQALTSMYLGSEVNVATMVHEFGHQWDRYQDVVTRLTSGQEGGFTRYLATNVEGGPSPFATSTGNVANLQDIYDNIIQGGAAKASHPDEYWADLFMSAVLHNQGYQVFDCLTVSDGNDCGFLPVGWRSPFYLEGIQQLLEDTYQAVFD